MNKPPKYEAPRLTTYGDITPFIEAVNDAK